VPVPSATIEEVRAFVLDVLCSDWHHLVQAYRDEIIRIHREWDHKNP
jgi:hypothetical protein